MIKALLDASGVSILRAMDVNPLFGLPTLSTLDLLPDSVSVKDLVSFLDLCAVQISSVSLESSGDLLIHYLFSFPASYASVVPCTLYEVGNGKNSLLTANLLNHPVSSLRIEHGPVLQSGACLCGCASSATESSSSGSALQIILPLILGLALILGVGALIMRRIRIVREIEEMKKQLQNAAPSYARPPRTLPTYIDPPHYQSLESSRLVPRQAPPYQPPPPYPLLRGARVDSVEFILGDDGDWDHSDGEASMYSESKSLTELDAFSLDYSISESLFDDAPSRRPVPEYEEPPPFLESFLSVSAKYDSVLHHSPPKIDRPPSYEPPPDFPWD